MLKKINIVDRVSGDARLQRRIIVDAKKIVEDQEALLDIEKGIKKILTLLSHVKKRGLYSNALEEIQKFIERLEHSQKFLDNEITRQLLESDRFLREFNGLLEDLNSNEAFKTVLSVIHRDERKDLIVHLDHNDVHEVFKCLKETSYRMKKAIKDGEPFTLFGISDKKIIKQANEIRIEEHHLEDLIAEIRKMLSYHITPGNVRAARIVGKRFAEDFKILFQIVKEYYNRLYIEFSVEIHDIVKDLLMGREIIEILSRPEFRKHFPPAEQLLSRLNNIITEEHDFEKTQYLNFQKELSIEEHLEETVKALMSKMESKPSLEEAIEYIKQAVIRNPIYLRKFYDHIVCKDHSADDKNVWWVFDFRVFADDILIESHRINDDRKFDGLLYDVVFAESLTDREMADIAELFRRWFNHLDVIMDPKDSSYKFSVQAINLTHINVKHDENRGPYVEFLEKKKTSFGLRNS